VLRIWIRIRKFLGLPDPDPLVRSIDPDPAQDPSVIKKNRKNLDSSCFVTSFQCSGSMTFWCGSGSADPCLQLMDPDPDSDPDADPSIFITDLQDANKKLT
jgi:hypothetical protein